MKVLATQKKMCATGVSDTGSKRKGLFLFCFDIIVSLFTLLGLGLRQCCGSGIRIFFFPSRIQIFLSQKIVSNLSEIWSGFFIPDTDFLPIPDPGSRGQKGTGSRIRNTWFRCRQSDTVFIVDHWRRWHRCHIYHRCHHVQCKSRERCE